MDDALAVALIRVLRLLRLTFFLRSYGRGKADALTWKKADGCTRRKPCRMLAPCVASPSHGSGPGRRDRGALPPPQRAQPLLIPLMRESDATHTLSIAES